MSEHSKQIHNGGGADFDESVICDTATAIASREIRDRVRRTSSALTSWQKIKDTAGEITDEDQRMSYLHESLEKMTMHDLIAIAGACNAGLL